MTKHTGPARTRRHFLRMAGAAGLAAPALIGSRGFAAEPQRIRMGMVTPLEGECAQWGIPITRAGQIWADEHNAEGGILCGDGERHMIDYSAYTNVCFYPNEELTAFRPGPEAPMPVTLEVKTAFRQETRAGTVARIGVQVTKVGTRSVGLTFAMRDAGDDALLATCEVSEVFMDPQTRRSCPIPDALREALVRASAPPQG